MSVQEVPNPQIPEWSLGDRLRKARRTAGISILDMAEYLDVVDDTVTNYELDKTRPRRSVLMAYASRCNVPLGWIESGDDGQVTFAERRSEQKPHRGKERRSLGGERISSWSCATRVPAQGDPLLVSPRLLAPRESGVPFTGIATRDAIATDLVIDLTAVR